jgi:hypothetical protein
METVVLKNNFHRSLLAVHRDWISLLEKIIFTSGFLEDFQRAPGESLLVRLPDHPPSSVRAILLAYQSDFGTIQPLLGGSFLLDPEKAESVDVLKALSTHAQDACVFATEKSFPRLREAGYEKTVYGFRKFLLLKNQEDAVAALNTDQTRGTPAGLN